MVEPVEEIRLPSLSSSAPIVDGARATTDFRLYLEKTKEALEAYLGTINETIQQIVDILDGTQSFDALNVNGNTITAIGSMAEQNADDVEITGGEMSGVDLSANDATLTGRTTLGDADFYAELGADAPTLNADALSYLTFDRAANTWTLNAGNVGAIVLDPSGDGVVLNTPGGLLRFAAGADTFIYYPDPETMGLAADGLERLRLDTNGVTLTTPGAVLWFGIGGPAIYTPSAGQLELSGDLEITGNLAVDGRTTFESSGFYAQMDGPDGPTFAFDAGDTLSYDRTVNGFIFTIGGTVRALLSASGLTLADGLAVTLPTYADNAAALAGGLTAPSFYKTATGEVRVVV